MGYDTTFRGSFKVTPEMSARHAATINNFAQERHERTTHPSYYCQWVTNDVGSRIEWDGGEKFDEYVKWIEYLVKFYFEPWGYKLNGVVAWEGEEHGDAGKIVIKDNVVTTVEAKFEFDTSDVIDEDD